MIVESTLKVLGLLLICMSISSCATLLNKRQSVITFQTSENVDYVFKGDTLVHENTNKFARVYRNKKQPITLTFINKDYERQINIRPKKVGLYYLNVFSPYWLGFGVDELTRRKWTYPKNVFVNMEKGSYLPYFPMDTSMVLNKPNRLSLTPLAPLGNQHPGIELSYQRALGMKYAAQITYKQFIPAQSDLAKNATGFSLGFELKRYYRNTTNSRFYLSANLEYLHKNHEAVLRYSEPQDFIQQEEPVAIWSLIGIEKRFISMVPRFGIEYYLTKRLLVDGYFGVGLRYRNVSHKNTPHGLVLSATYWEWFDIEYDSNRPTQSFSANLDLNFKIAYSF